IAPPRRALTTLSDESLRPIGGRRCSWRSRCNPVFRLLQHRRTQQQPRRAFCLRPAPRLLSKLCVLSDPTDIGVERFSKAISTVLELRGVIEENEIQLRQLFWDGLVFYRPIDDRCEPFVQRRCELDLFECDGPRPDCIGAEHEHHSVRTGNQHLYSLPPF